MITKESLIQKAIKSNKGLVHNFVPVIDCHFNQFLEDIGYDGSPKSYFTNVSYQDKKQLFSELGFNVLYLSATAIKVDNFLKEKMNEKSLHQQFLDQEINIFIVEISAGSYGPELYFILQYEDEDKLAKQTVDYDEVERVRKTRENFRKLFGSYRKNIQED